MRAAIEAHDTGADVALISKIHPVRSHSGAAEGGINAALGNAADDDRCQGVIAWNLIEGGLASIGAKTVIIATGGAGRLYTGTTNAYACTGDGMTLALREGVALKDMEMMQFHPTTLAPTGVLITEGTRGEGAFLLNSEGGRFLKRDAPNAMELASPGVVSRGGQAEIDE